VYYGYSEIGNKEIVTLFGKLSSATITRLKKLAKAEMLNQEVASYRLYAVNTKIAFEVWGIDFADLEKRQRKLTELKLNL